MLTNQPCLCALPAITGGTECCKNCVNNPNRPRSITFDSNKIILTPIEELPQKVSDSIDFFAREATYTMNYTTLRAIYDYFKNCKQDSLLEEIKNNMEIWRDFLIDNL